MNIDTKRMGQKPGEVVCENEIFDNRLRNLVILNAVWYIVDRAGYADEIITAIGYPEDGPMKWEVVYLPLVTNPAVGLGDKAVTFLGPVMKKPPRPLKDFSERYERKWIRTR